MAEESGRISPWSISEGNCLASDGERMISETGLAPERRGRIRCGGAGDWTPEERKRRNRFAFSRGPASFLRMESRRLCLGKGSSTALRSTVRRREERVRMRLASDNGGVNSGGELSTDPDRDAICAICTGTM